MSTTAPRLAPGTIFSGEFRVVRALREEDPRAVYVVEQVSTGRQLVLKLLTPDLISGDGARDRFTQQVRIGANITSDHIVDVRAAGVDSATGAPWLVTEYLEGTGLASKLADIDGALPDWDEAISQVAHALAAAHQAGVAHGAISPETIFVGKPTRAGEPFHIVLLDLGIPEIAKGRTRDESHDIAYRSPDMLSGAGPSLASDVWALAMIAFRLATGKDYWRGHNVTAITTEIKAGAGESASARAKSLGALGTPSAAFDAWFARCVTAPASERFPDAGAALEGLADTLTEASGLADVIADVPPGELSALVAPPQHVKAAKPPPLPVIQAIKENPKPAIIAVLSLVIVALAAGVGLGAVFRPSADAKLNGMARAQVWSRGEKDAAEKACNGGDPVACHGLGLMYLYGVKIAKDEAAAVGMFTKSCDAGDAAGCNSLAGRYLNGEGVTKDAARAADLFSKSCDKGEAISCSDLAELYRNGVGVKKDEAKAKTLTDRACKAGMTESCGQ